MKKFRVQKIISNRGYCSRRKAEELIKENRVKVNGNPVKIGDTCFENDKIEIDNREIKSVKKTYIVFNKPKFCVTALIDKKYKTVMDFIKIKQRVFPIGRLDYLSDGLLILTNDGDFANRIMHPRYNITKTYLVTLTEKIKKQDLAKLKKGILLDDGPAKPDYVKVLPKNRIELGIHDGRNRIIRRIFNKLNYKVINLTRTKIGKLELGKLKKGKYKIVSKEYLISKIIN